MGNNDCQHCGKPWGSCPCKTIRKLRGSLFSGKAPNEDVQGPGGKAPPGLERMLLGLVGTSAHGTPSARGRSPEQELERALRFIKRPQDFYKDGVFCEPGSEISAVLSQ